MAKNYFNWILQKLHRFSASLLCRNGLQDSGWFFSVQSANFEILFLSFFLISHMKKKILFSHIKHKSVFHTKVRKFILVLCTLYVILNWERRERVYNLDFYVRTKPRKRTAFKNHHWQCLSPPKCIEDSWEAPHQSPSPLNWTFHADPALKFIRTVI